MFSFDRLLSDFALLFCINFSNSVNCSVSGFGKFPEFLRLPFRSSGGDNIAAANGDVGGDSFDGNDDCADRFVFNGVSFCGDVVDDVVEGVVGDKGFGEGDLDRGFCCISFNCSMSCVIGSGGAAATTAAAASALAVLTAFL